MNNDDNTNPNPGAPTPPTPPEQPPVPPTPPSSPNPPTPPAPNAAPEPNTPPEQSIPQQPPVPPAQFGQIPQQQLPVQPMQPGQTNLNPQQSNKKLIIILASVLGGLLIIGIVILIIVLANVNKPNTANKNEYEASNNTATTTSTSSEKTTLGQFEFQHVNGYQYKKDSDKLAVTDGQYAFIITSPMRASLSDVKAQQEEIKQQFQQNGITISDTVEKTASGVEMLVFSVTQSGKNMYLILAQSPSNNYIFELAGANRDYSHNETILEEAGKILSNVKSSGDNSTTYAPESTDVSNTHVNTNISVPEF